MENENLGNLYNPKKRIIEEPFRPDIFKDAATEAEVVDLIFSNGAVVSTFVLLYRFILSMMRLYHNFQVLIYGLPPGCPLNSSRRQRWVMRQSMQRNIENSFAQRPFRNTSKHSQCYGELEA